MALCAEHVAFVCLGEEEENNCVFLLCGGKGVSCAKAVGCEKVVRRRLEEGDTKAKGDNCKGQAGEVPLDELTNYIQTSPTQKEEKNEKGKRFNPG